MDESNFNLFSRRNIGRSARGQRAFRRLHNSRGRNVNILLAVDDTHVVHWKSILGSCKEEFVDFFGELSEKLGEQNATIYMDNARPYLFMYSNIYVIILE